MHHIVVSSWVLGEFSGFTLKNRPAVADLDGMFSAAVSYNSESGDF